MATKTYNTRIQLKYDSYANWTTNNPTPLSGEVCIVVIPAETGAVVQEPSVLFKVGDGTTAFNALPYVSAIAADVYDWAKAAVKPSYTAEEIEGLADFIGTEIQDTDTQYKLEQDTTDTHILKLSSKGLTDADWTVVATITTADTVYDDTALADRVTALEGLVGSVAVATQIANAIAALDLANTYDAKGAAAQALTDAKAYADGKDEAINVAKKAGDDAQADVDALEGKVGVVPDGKTVVQMIADAQDAATYDDTEIRGKVDTLIGTDTGKSARAIATEEANTAINDFATKVTDDGVINSYKELIDYVAAHGGEAAEMAAAIEAIQAVIAGIGGEGEQPTVVAYVTEAIAALKIGDYAKAADLTALATRVTTAEGKITALESEVAKKANDADLAAVAKSGNVNDLVQTEGDYIIFNCGAFPLI